MIHKSSRSKAREKRHYRQRRHLSGTPDRPRLAVFRSNKHIYAQIIDDTAGHTLAASSTLDKSVSAKCDNTSNVEAARIVGEAVARKAVEKGINAVVFDRAGHIYHGRIKALAEAAREAGLLF